MPCSGKRVRAAPHRGGGPRGQLDRGGLRSGLAPRSRSPPVKPDSERQGDGEPGEPGSQVGEGREQPCCPQDAQDGPSATRCAGGGAESDDADPLPGAVGSHQPARPNAAASTSAPSGGAVTSSAVPRASTVTAKPKNGQHWYSAIASWGHAHPQVRLLNKRSGTELMKPHQLMLAARVRAVAASLGETLH